MKEYCPICRRFEEVTLEKGIEKVSYDYETFWIELEQIFCKNCDTQLYQDDVQYRNSLKIREEYEKHKSYK